MYTVSCIIGQASYEGIDWLRGTFYSLSGHLPLFQSMRVDCVSLQMCSEVNMFGGGELNIISNKEETLFKFCTNCQYASVFHKPIKCKRKNRTSNCECFNAFNNKHLGIKNFPFYKKKQTL